MSTTSDFSTAPKCVRCTDDWLCDKHVYQQIQNFAYQIFDNGQPKGSGFLHGGYVYTALHNISDVTNMSFNTGDYTDQNKFLDIQTLGTSALSLAQATDLIRVAIHSSPVLAAPAFDDSSLEVGEEVYFLGFSSYSKNRYFS